jgi:murein DD-endopeptidase MepM/ murein hydrolase activator NlpD
MNKTFKSRLLLGLVITTSAIATMCIMGVRNPLEAQPAIACSSRNIELRPQPGGLVLRRGATFTTCNGYTFVFQNDGNVVLYGSRGVVWATGTEGTGASALVIQEDGNIVLYSQLYQAGQVLWATNTNGNPGAFFAAQTDGNLVVYTAQGRPLWASNTMGGVRGTVSAAADWRRGSNPQPPQTSGWITPWLANMNPRISQGWHPDGYRPSQNLALDFAIPAGTSIVAPIDSRVVSTCNAGRDHRAIFLQAKDGQRYTMIHVRASNSHVYQGREFRQGEVIGTVAPETTSAGLNTSCAVTYGVHLHLGLPRQGFVLGNTRY